MKNTLPLQLVIAYNERDYPYGDIKVRAKTGGNIIALSGYKASYFSTKRAAPMTLIFGTEPH